MMSESELSQIVDMLFERIFSKKMKRILITIAIAILGGSGTFIWSGITAYFRTQQNTIDIENDREFNKEQFEKKVDKDSFHQYINENTKDHKAIKEDIKEVSNGQLIIQEDVKKLLQRK
jgi:predicted transcriptional regulator